MTFHVEAVSGNLAQYADVIEYFDGIVMDARTLYEWSWSKQIAEIELLDLMDLVKFQDLVDEDLIINHQTITIYDGYIE